MTTERVTGDLPEATAAEVAASVDPEATVLMSGIGAGPKQVPMALADRADELSLRIPSSADAGFLTDTQLIDAGGASFRYPFALWQTLTDAANDGRVDFVDDHFADLDRTVRTGALGDPDLAVVEAVRVGPDRIVPTTAVGATPTFIAAADRVVVEVNEGVPLATGQFHDIYDPGLPPREPIPLSEPGERIGDGYVPVEPGQIDAVVRTDTPPMPYPFHEPSDAEIAAAGNVLDLLRGELRENPAMADALTLEVGVGTLGNEVMGRLDELPIEDREVAYFGEVVQDGLLDLIDDGVLSTASATGLVVSDEGMDRIYTEPERYAESIVTRPMSVSNAPAVIRRLGVVAVNAAVEVDLYGNVNSSHIRGSRLLQGIGGSGDFARNGLLSVFALPSTVDGDLSRIVPMATHVDHPDHDVDVVVTEYGAADLRGRPPQERAERLVERCAHPDARPALREYLERADGGHVPHDLDTALDPLELPGD